MKVSIKYTQNGKAKVVNVKIEGRDLWEGDVTLARVIYPFLKKYRKLYDDENAMRGYPAEFASDPNKPEGPDNPDRFDEWLICLDKMIYSFGWLSKDRNWDGPERDKMFKECDIIRKLHCKELNKLRKQDDERFAAVKPHGGTNSLEWDREVELLGPVYEKYHLIFEEHHRKLQEGIDLFAKHYGSLWT